MNPAVQMMAGTSHKKQFLIAGIILAALAIIIIIYLFAGFRTAGQATLTQLESTFAAGQGGIVPFQVPSAAIVGSDFTIIIGANIGTAQSVAFDFTLDYPADVFEFSAITPLVRFQSADAFSRTTPSAGSVLFEYATLDFTRAMTGAANLAQVTFRLRRVPTNAEYQAIAVRSLHVYNLGDDSNQITSIINGQGVSQCTEQTCRSEFGLILGSECVDLTSEECQSRYTLTPTSQCNPCTCQTLQQQFGSLEEDVQISLCARYGIKEQECAAAALFTLDINGDGQINGQDAYIVLKTAEAKTRDDCGASAMTPCQYGATYICDDGSFRVNGYHEFTYNHENCNFANMREYTMVR